VIPTLAEFSAFKQAPITMQSSKDT